MVSGKIKESYQERVNKALSDGKFWRAKEILQGRIGFHPYDPECYELYGNVLLLMGDTINAGRILFASGQQNPEYREAIQLFLEKHRSTTWNNLLTLLPNSIRRLPYEKLPTSVQSELSLRGYIEVAKAKQDLLAGLNNRSPQTRWDWIKGELFGLIVLLIFGWLMLCLLIGIFFMIKYMWQFIYSVIK